MQSKLKTIGWLAVVQAGCLAVGIWSHQQFLAAVAADHRSRTTAGDAAPAASAEGLPAETRFLVHLLAFVWTGSLQTIAAGLVLSRMQGEQDRLQTRSQEEALLRSRDLVRTRDAVIFGLAKLAESRDPDTGHHLERIALYSTRLATALRRRPRFRRQITPAFIRSIGISSALHDIGKVGVEDSILLKPGPLTPEERAQIEQHTCFGADCIRQIQRRIGDPMFLEMAYQITRSHHERWDGSGYPDGLSGEAIPLAARIVAIADVYDALSVRRVYKPPLPHERCVQEIRDAAGAQFDPELVEVFLEIQEQFREIAEKFRAIEHRRDESRETSEKTVRRDYVEFKMTGEQQALLESTVEALPTPAKTGAPSAAV